MNKEVKGEKLTWRLLSFVQWTPYWIAEAFQFQPHFLVFVCLWSIVAVVVQRGDDEKSVWVKSSSSRAREAWSLLWRHVGSNCGSWLLFRFVFVFFVGGNIISPTLQFWKETIYFGPEFKSQRTHGFMPKRRHDRYFVGYRILQQKDCEKNENGSQSTWSTETHWTFWTKQTRSLLRTLKQSS